MPGPFKDDKAVYQTFGGLFERLAQDGDAGKLAQESKLILRFRFKAPEAEILLNCRKDPVDVKCGKTQTSADLDLTVTAEALDQILLGKLGMASALKSGELRARGSLLKVKALAPIFDAAQRLYTA